MCAFITRFVEIINIYKCNNVKTLPHASFSVLYCIYICCICRLCLLNLPAIMLCFGSCLILCTVLPNKTGLNIVHLLHDVHPILVYQDKDTAAMLVYSEPHFLRTNGHIANVNINVKSMLPIDFI